MNQFNFEYDYEAIGDNDLSFENWEELVNNLVKYLDNTPQGMKLQNKLIDLEKNYTFIFTNKEVPIRVNNKIYIYVSSNPKNMSILTLNNTDNESLTTIFKENKRIFDKLLFISNYQESYNIINSNEIEYLNKILTTNEQHIFFHFIHTLIKIVRFMFNMKSKDATVEKASIIHGIRGLTLIIDDEIITENAVRQGYNSPPRVV